MSTDTTVDDEITTRVAQDRYAETRLLEKPISIHTGQSGGIIAAHETSECRIALHADPDTTPAALHEALAATYLEAALYLGLNIDGGEKR